MKRRGTDSKTIGTEEKLSPANATRTNFSLNESLMYIDNDYIGYHKDLPKPEQLAERRMKMTDNTSVFLLEI